MGWTFAYVETLTYREVRMLKAEWRERPPTHWLVASYLGYKPPTAPAAIPADAAEEEEALMRLFGQAGVPVSARGPL